MNILKVDVLKDIIEQCEEIQKANTSLVYKKASLEIKIGALKLSVAILKNELMLLNKTINTNIFG